MFMFPGKSSAYDKWLLQWYLYIEVKYEEAFYLSFKYKLYNTSFQLEIL